MKQLLLSRLPILLAIALLVAACGQAPGQNQDDGELPPPLSIEFELDIEQKGEGHYAAGVGELVTVQVELSGQGSPLARVTWEVDGGEFAEEGYRRARWQAPMEEGSYKLTVTVEPLLAHHSGAEASVTIDVVDPCEVGDGCIEIRTLADLDSVRSDLTANYILVNDIDASDSETMNGGAGLEPIGGPSDQFTGSFDGRNHTITGLHIDYPSLDGVGLFGYVNTDGELKNVTLEGLSVVGGKWVGGLVGVLNRGTVRNVHVEGQVEATDDYAGGIVGTGSGGPLLDVSVNADVSGQNEIGGLAGRLQGGTSIERSRSEGTVSGTSRVGGLLGSSSHLLFEASSSAATVTGTGNLVGGLIGTTSNSSVATSSFTGSVSGVERVGGLVGHLGSAHNDREFAIERSFVTGDVTGTNRVGGVAGHSFGGSVADSYGLGGVEGDDEVGGLIGSAELALELFNAYSTGLVVRAPGATNVGGLIGRIENPAEATVTSSYWDMETTLQPSSPAGEGRTTAQMYTQATYEGWDFDEVWSIQEGTDYPDLQANSRE